VPLGPGDLAGQAILFLLEQVERNGAGVVGVKELPALGGELGQPVALAGGLCCACSRMPARASSSFSRTRSACS